MSSCLRDEITGASNEVSQVSLRITIASLKLTYSIVHKLIIGDDLNPQSSSIANEFIAFSIVGFIYTKKALFAGLLRVQYSHQSCKKK